jgi:hypothetical protein
MTNRDITFEVMMLLNDMDDVWSVNECNFNALALNIFQYQAKNNKIYARYLDLIGKSTESISHYSEIPFLPISLFKTHDVKTGKFETSHVFESSTTTGTIPSRHFIKNINDYHQNCLKIIEQKIGSLSDYEVFGLLPNYLERKNSSLVSMVKFLMEENQQSMNFFLYDFKRLCVRLHESKKKKLLFGVSFALLDFAQEYPLDLEDLIIIETGGMKGRKKEITKSELYEQLQNSFKTSTIISEYGMTELLSQAYSDKDCIYKCPPWMKILPRPDNDPLSKDMVKGHTAALNIIDLANINSCCFIATDDLGKVFEDGRFEVTGRLDQSDIRGCSLMAI